MRHEFKKLGRFKILEVNTCEIESCNCGWNISIGGKSVEDLEKILDFLRAIL